MSYVLALIEEGWKNCASSGKIELFMREKSRGGWEYLCKDPNGQTVGEGTSSKDFWFPFFIDSINSFSFPVIHFPK